MSTHERRIVTAIVALLLGTAIWFRLLRLASVPGLSGDEGWWGVQALAWLAGRPYEPRTTSGNPIDLFFLVPVALLHVIGSPSFALLRLVPVLANVLALVAAFCFGRRLFGETTAWIHTVALAVLPTAIAHSRICQDPSQSVFWSGLVVVSGAARREGRRRGGTLVRRPRSPVPGRALDPPDQRLRRALSSPADRDATRRPDAGLAPGPHRPSPHHGGVPLAGGLIAAWFAFGIAARSYPLAGQALAVAGRRAPRRRGQWLEFAANNVRLFNGITVIHYFSGARPWTLPYDAGAMLAAVLALGGFGLAASAPTVAGSTRP